MAELKTPAEKLSELVGKIDVRTASSLRHPGGHSEWNYRTLIGRFIELSGARESAGMTVAVGLVHEAQEAGEPVAWITREESSFFPPDVAAHGVDLDALVVIRVPDTNAIARAADTLVRSGGFGLAVLDLDAHHTMPMPLQSRLMKLARTRNSCVLCLTRKPADAPSLSSLISLRADARRVRSQDGSFRCLVRILKDKQRSPDREHWEDHDGPMGLR